MRKVKNKKLNEKGWKKRTKNKTEWRKEKKCTENIKQKPEVKEFKKINKGKIKELIKRKIMKENENRKND